MRCWSSSGNAPTSAPILPLNPHKGPFPYFSEQAIIASGDKFKLNTGSEEKEYTVIIYGDVNSDGKITSADYIKIKNHIMETNKLSDLEMLFADANKDNKVTSADYVAIKNHIMETKLIVQ